MKFTDTRGWAMRHLVELDEIVGPATTITLADADKLKARASKLGATAEEFDRWISRYQIVNEPAAPQADPWPSEIRRRVRILLDTLRGVSTSDDWERWAQTRTLWSFLGLRQTVWLDQLRARATVLAAETSGALQDKAAVIEQELLDIVSQWLITDTGPASYVASVELDVAEALAKTAGNQLRINDELQPAELLELLWAAANAGAPLTWGDLQRLVAAASAPAPQDKVHEFDPDSAEGRLAFIAAGWEELYPYQPRHLFLIQTNDGVRRALDAGAAWIEQWHHERSQRHLRPPAARSATAAGGTRAKDQPALADGLTIGTRTGRIILFTKVGVLHDYRSTFVPSEGRSGLLRRRDPARYSVLHATTDLWRVYDGLAGTFVPVIWAGWTGHEHTGLAQAWKTASNGRRATPEWTRTQTVSSYGLMTTVEAAEILRDSGGEGIAWIGDTGDTLLPELTSFYQPGHSHPPTSAESACTAAFAALGTFQSYRTTGSMGMSETRMSQISSLNAHIDADLWDGFCFDLRQRDESAAPGSGSKASALLPTRTVVVRAINDSTPRWSEFEPARGAVLPQKGARVNVHTGQILPEYVGGSYAEPGRYRSAGRVEPQKFLVALYNGADETPNGGATGGASLRDCVIVERTEVQKFLTHMTGPSSAWPAGERPLFSQFRFEQWD